MRIARLPATLAACLVLSACGAAPAPVQAPPPGGGGGDAATGETPPPAGADPAPPEVETAPVAIATPMPEPPASAAPTPPPTPAVPPPAATAGGGGGAAPAATPPPAPTPSPSPSPSPSPRTLTLTVMGDRHLVTLSRYQAFGTSPFEVVSVEADAYDRPGVKFPALAGASRGRYGWKYARLTPETARQWSGDAGGPGEVFFLDSVGGEADNSGSWVVLERHDDGTRVHELRTEIAARTDVNTFDPARVAYVDLGDAPARWTFTGAWQHAESAPFTYPAGCFLVYTRADGVRDVAVLGPGATTLEARGYAYAFFVTTADERPDGDLRFTLTRP